MTAAPLRGRRILVTRALHQAGKLSAGLRALGAEPVEVPVLEIRSPASFDALDQALKNLATYDWLILTSANTARALADRANAIEVSLQNSAPPPVAAVGEATAEAARKAGLPVSLIPESYVAESLVESLKDQVRGRHILLARAAVARDVIPDALRTAGAQLDVIDAYQTVIPEAAPDQLRQALEQGIDAATFTSSSSVTHLADAARAANLRWPFPNVAAVSIGPITTQTLQDNNWPPAAEANPHDIPGLVAAVADLLTR